MVEQKELFGPKPGDAVYWSDPDSQTRTGRFVRVVERGKLFGLVEIEPTAYKAKRVYVPLDTVERIDKGGKSG